MKKSWAIGIVFLLLAVALCLVFFSDKLFGQKSTSASGSDGSGAGTPAPVSKFPLKKGSQGEAVRKLQQYLNSCMAYYLVLTPLDVDGIFGAKTEGMCVTITGNREITEEFYNQYIK